MSSTACVNGTQVYNLGGLRTLSHINISSQSQYLETGDLDAAMAIFNHPTVTNVTLSEVLTTTSENTRLTAQVLSVKKAKPKKFQKDGNSMTGLFSSGGVIRAGYFLSSCRGKQN